MSDVATAIDDQTLELSKKLDAIATNISNLNIGTQEGLIFTPLTLQPTFEDGATYGWYTAPANKENIFDGNESTATNTFRANSAQYSDCFLRINAGILIPQYSKIEIKMGISNLNNNKSYFEWSAGIGSGEKQPFWSEFKQRSTSETIVTFDRLLSFSWDWLQLTLVEAVTWPPLAKIYSIRIARVD